MPAVAKPVRSKEAKRTAPKVKPVGTHSAGPTVSQPTVDEPAVAAASPAKPTVNEPAGGEPAEGEAPPPNRAARRARSKGRGRSAPLATGQAKITKGAKSVPPPRIWASRRSG